VDNARRWFHHDPDATRAWLQRSGLPDDIQSKVTDARR
jgi:hypothetical protein